MKHLDKVLIASGLTLVLSGGIAAAALGPVGTNTVLAQLPGGVTMAVANSPFGAHGYLAAAAAYIGITEDALRAELSAGKTLAEVAVANGKTRDGLIAALTQAASTQIATLVDQPGNAFGPGGRGLGGRHVMITNDIAAAAAYIGTTEADLRTKLQAGQTLSQIATAAGKTRDGLIAAMVADGNAKIDAAQAAGTITADQATQMKANLTAHVTAEVDGTRPAGGPGGRGRHP